MSGGKTPGAILRVVIVLVGQLVCTYQSIGKVPPNGARHLISPPHTQDRTSSVIKMIYQSHPG